MAYDLTPFEVQLGEWLTDCLPIGYSSKVVAAEQRGVALAYPYATFQVIDETPLNATAGTTLTNVAVPGAPGRYVESTKQTFRALLSVNVYGPTAFADAQALTLEYQRFSRAQCASARGFTVAAHSGLRRLSESTALADEQRVQVDFTVYYKRTLESSNLEVSEVIGQPE